MLLLLGCLRFWLAWKQWVWTSTGALLLCGKGLWILHPHPPRIWCLSQHRLCLSSYRHNNVVNLRCKRARKDVWERHAKTPVLYYTLYFNLLLWKTSAITSLNGPVTSMKHTICSRSEYSAIGGGWRLQSLPLGTISSPSPFFPISITLQHYNYWACTVIFCPSVIYFAYRTHINLYALAFNSTYWTTFTVATKNVLFLCDSWQRCKCSSSYSQQYVRPNLTTVLTTSGSVKCFGAVEFRQTVTHQEIHRARPGT